MYIGNKWKKIVFKIFVRLKFFGKFFNLRGKRKFSDISVLEVKNVN